MPDVQTIQLPHVQTIKLPYVQTIQLPHVQTIQLPDVQTIQLPDVQTIQLPDVQTIQLPCVQTIQLPDVQTIQLPYVQTLSLLYFPSSDLSRWFVASIVLIVLLAVVFIVTIVVCCCFCMRGRSARAYNQEKKPYDPFDRSTYPAMAEGFGVVGPAATGSIPGYGYPGTNQTYAPSGFTITQQAPTNDSPLFLSNFWLWIIILITLFKL